MRGSPSKTIYTDKPVVLTMALGGSELGLAFIIIGILMLLAELSAPGAFILVPATVLLVLGFVGMVAPDVLISWWSPVIVAVVVIPITYVTMKMYQKLAPPAPPETTVATSLVGMTGVVVADVAPNNLKGKVRIEHDTWSATSSKAIPAGKKVVVKMSEGVHVTVEEVE
jgi:membrane protein implicated in regulation of membrane protease activity